MADERDPELTKHYRELEALEPSAALDEKILAAARNAASQHVPLMAPAGRHRWYYSLAAAAVLVFAVALTLHIDRDRPDAEAVPPASVRGEIKPAPQPEPKPTPHAAEPAPAFTPDPGARAADQANLERARVQAEQARVAAEASRGDARRQEVESARMSAARSMASAQRAAPPENPERWLDRIAELRSRGRHADADRELAAFRKAYPSYQLSDLMRERVEGTPTPSR